MKSISNRAGSRETVDLVIRFVDAALRYRFLYVQNRTDGQHHVDAVQRAVLGSIQKAHTNAQALLRTIEACGLPASESHDAWRLLSIGLPDASYADCERALKNWAKAATEAAGPVGPDNRTPLTDDEKLVYELIPKLPDGITGKSIVEKLSHKLPWIDETRVSKVCTGALKAYGVKNRRTTGYYRTV